MIRTKREKNENRMRQGDSQPRDRGPRGLCKHTGKFPGCMWRLVCAPVCWNGKLARVGSHALIFGSYVFTLVKLIVVMIALLSY